MRNHRVLDDPAVLHLHDHVAWCGARNDELERVAITAFSVGAARNERMIFVCDDPHAYELRANDELDRALDSGALTSSSIDEVYGDVEALDPDAQLAVFSAAVDDALAAGYTGIRVVADNTPLVCGDDESFQRWLAWEQLTDRFQDERPVLGLCFFDASRIPVDRLAVLGAVHPITHASSPPFRLFTDDGVVVLIGEVDDETVGTLHRALAVRHVDAQTLVVDVSRAEFIDHRTLQAFAQLGTDIAPVRLHGVHPTLRRLWRTLDLTTDDLQFS